MSSSVTAGQVGGPLAAILPLATAALVGWGMDDHTAGLIAGGAIMLLAGGYQWWQNRPVKLAQQLVDKDVRIDVGPAAPQELQDAANDPNQPGFKPRVPPR
jgi:hypothetical protein